MNTKTATKTEPNNKPDAVATIASLAEIAVRFHADEKPTLASIARTCGRASRLLRISDLDERMACETPQLFSWPKGCT